MQDKGHFDYIQKPKNAYKEALNRKPKIQKGFSGMLAQLAPDEANITATSKWISAGGSHISR